jgi:uncharacterized membrane protein (DUF485 family)
MSSRQPQDHGSGADIREPETSKRRKHMANAAPQQQHTKHSAKELLESTDFKALVSTRLTVSNILLVLLFVGYYGYIFVASSMKEFVNSKIGDGATTVGIPLGVAVIVFAFVLTAIYVSWANKKYDPEVERLKNQLKH